eukprot:g19136.t1
MPVVTPSEKLHKVSQEMIDLIHQTQQQKQWVGVIKGDQQEMTARLENLRSMGMQLKEAIRMTREDSKKLATESEACHGGSFVDINCEALKTMQKKVRDLMKQMEEEHTAHETEVDLLRDALNCAYDLLDSNGIDRSSLLQIVDVDTFDAGKPTDGINGTEEKGNDVNNNDKVSTGPAAGENDPYITAKRPRKLKAFTPSPSPDAKRPMRYMVSSPPVFGKLTTSPKSANKTYFFSSCFGEYHQIISKSAYPLSQIPEQREVSVDSWKDLY